MMIDEQKLIDLANWKSDNKNWVDFRENDKPEANYNEIIEDLGNIKGYKIITSNGWKYSDTFFDFFLFQQKSKRKHKIPGIHVSLNRFAPIGIYSAGSGSYSRSEKEVFVGSRPCIDLVYCVPDDSWNTLEDRIIKLFKEHEIYMPDLLFLKKNIWFELPELFKQNANLGVSKVFHIIINDLY